MALVVVVGGTLACSHQGQARLVSGDSRLSADGKDVVVGGQEVGVSFGPGAMTPCPFSTPGGSSPCAATMAAMAGISTKVVVGTLGVLLDTAKGKATNAQDASATWSVQSAGQSIFESDG
jgi:hypothetical protein